MRHLEEEELILHFYGEGEDPAAAEQHLAECTVCREQLAETRRLLEAVPAVRVPERSEAYGAQVWDRLQPQLAYRRGRAWSERVRARAWAISAAAVFLLTVGFLVGRTWHPLGKSAVPSLAADAGDRILLAAVAEHLQRSQMLILEYVHSDRGPDSAQRAQLWAESLVAANRLYRQVALAQREQAMASVLDELEPVLVEIEHSSSDQPAETLAERIQSKGVLFKIRVVEAQIDQRRTTTTQASWKL